MYVTDGGKCPMCGRGGTREQYRHRRQTQDVSTPTISVQQRIQKDINTAGIKAVTLPRGVTNRQFSEALHIAPRDLVRYLITQGVFATLNQVMMEDFAISMAATFGVQIEWVDNK